MGNQEIPCQQRQVGWRRRVAFFLRLLPGDAAPLLDNGHGQTHGQATRGAARGGPEVKGFLPEREIGRHRREALGQRHRAHTPSNRWIAVGLLLEATTKRRLRRRQAGPGVALHLASSNDAQPPWLRPGDDLIEIARRCNGPCGQRHMTTQTAGLIPDGVHLGACVGRTASSAGNSLVECVGQFNARAVSERDFGQGGTPAIIPPRVEGVALGPGLTEHVLQKGQGVPGQALIKGGRRDGHGWAQGAGLRRHLGPRRLGRPPGPKGHTGPPELARHLRGRWTRPGRRAVAALSSAAQKSVTMVTAWRVYAGLEVSCECCWDA